MKRWVVAVVLACAAVACVQGPVASQKAVIAGLGGPGVYESGWVDKGGGTPDKLNGSVILGTGCFVDNDTANAQIRDAAYQVWCCNTNCKEYCNQVVARAGYYLPPEGSGSTGNPLSPYEKPMNMASVGNVIHTNTPYWHTAIIVGVDRRTEGVLLVRHTNWPSGSYPHDQELDFNGSDYHIYAIAPIEVPCCTPANIWWTSAPVEGRWYRSNECLAYGTSGSDLNVASSAMCLADGGPGCRDYWARAWNGCGDVTVHFNGCFDNQPPSLGWAGDSAPASTWLRGSPAARWSWSDAHSRIKGGWYRWNGGATSDGSPGVAQIPDGKNTLEIYCEDQAWTGGSQSGNSSTISAEFWLDNTAPAVSAPVPDTPAVTNAETINLALSASDSQSGVARIVVYVNDQQAGTMYGATGSFAWSTAGWPDGDYSIKAVAFDAAAPGGNSAESAPITITLDKTGPGIVYDLPVAPCGQGWFRFITTLSMHCSDAGTGVATCSVELDGEPAASPVTIPEGVHEVVMSTTDNAGNVTTEIVTVKVDLTQPTTSNLLAAASLDTVSASWTQTDALSGVNDAAWWLGTTPGGQQVVPERHTGGPGHFWLTNLNLNQAQTYYLSVKVVDRACNESPVQTVTLPALAPWTGKPFVIASGGFTYEPRVSDNFRVTDTLGEPIAGDFTVPGLTGMMAGMWLPDAPVPPIVPLGEAMKLADGSVFKSLKGLVVTGGTDDFSGGFFVEEEDRSRAARVELEPLAQVTALRGRKVALTGQVTTLHGEKVVRYPSVTDAGSGSVRPLVMPNQTTFGLFGLDPAALLVTTSGWAIPVSADAMFIVDDQGPAVQGDGLRGVWVMLDTLKAPFAFPEAGYVVVTGVLSQTEVDGQWARCIRPRDVSDIGVVF